MPRINGGNKRLRPLTGIRVSLTHWQGDPIPGDPVGLRPLTGIRVSLTGAIYSLLPDDLNSLRPLTGIRVSLTDWHTLHVGAEGSGSPSPYGDSCFSDSSRGIC